MNTVSIWFNGGQEREIIQVPQHLSPSDQQIFADRIASTALNAAITNGGPEIYIDAPEDWRRPIQTSFTATNYHQKITAALSDYYGCNTVFHYGRPPRPDRGDHHQDTAWAPSIFEYDTEGTYFGVDVGGTCRKSAAVCGEREFVLDILPDGSYTARSTTDYIKLIQDTLRAAKNRLKEQFPQHPQIRGVTISLNCAVDPKGKPVMSRDVRNRLGGEPPIEEAPDHFKKWIAAEFGPEVASQTSLLNDGIAGAFYAARLCGVGDTAFLGLGSSVAFGFIDGSGGIAPGYGHVHYLRIDWEPAARGCHKGLPGALAYHIGMQGLLGIARDFQLLDDADLDLESARFAAQDVIQKADANDRGAIAVARTMGSYAAAALGELSRFWPIRNLVLGGGLMSGRFGRELIVAARDELRRRFRALSQQMNIRGCGEKCIYSSALGAALHARSVGVQNL